MGAATAPLVGRDADVATLRDAVMSARTPGPARLVLVTGEAGIGKSRLVGEVLDDCDDALVLTGHAADMSTGEIPFGVLADTVRDLVRQVGAEALTPTEHEALAPLLPGSPPSTRVERVQVLSAVLDLLQRLCAERSLVWWLEDLQWADTATRDLLNLAVRALHGRLLVVATVRTDDPSRTAGDEAALTSYVAGLARLPDTRVVPLGRLTPEQVRLQLRALADARLTPAVAARVERLSDGVPFAVEELVAAEGRPELSTTAGVAAGRLAALTGDARRLVDAAAVGEGHLRTGLLEQVVDATPDELDAALAEAVHAGILVTDHTADAVGFRHALLRDAADRALGPGARRSWHRRWAEVIEASPGVLAADPAALAVAEHWDQARDPRRALAATVAALPAAGRICRTDEEARLWTRVMHAYATLDDAEQVAGLTTREAFARAMTACGFAARAQWVGFVGAVPAGRFTEAERTAFAVLGEDENPKGEANLQSQERIRAAADAFEDSEPDLMAAIVWAVTGSRMRGDRARGDALLTRAMDAAHATGDPRAVLLVGTMGSYRGQVNGDPEGGAALVRDVLGRYPDESWEGVLIAMGNLVWCELVQGHHRRADAVATDALARLRHPHLSPNAWEHLVENATATWLLTGQWERTRRLFEEANPWWADDLRSSNARADILDLVQRGTAGDLSRWPPALEHPVPGMSSRAAIRELLARDAASRDDLPRMRAVLAPAWADEAILLSDDQLWCSVLVAARAEADAALAGPRDDRDDALTHLRTIETVTRDFRRHGPLGEVWPLDLAAQLDRFHGRDARPALRAALAGWERIGHVPDVGVTHLALAEQEAVHGDRDAARHHLAAGREIAERLEARPMLARADALTERYALGSRERRTDDVLTDREVEVLRLVAEGMTNGQIGTRLFMSPKTASVHVSHILAKLGAANRTEAASVARRQGLLVD